MAPAVRCVIELVFAHRKTAVHPMKKKKPKKITDQIFVCTAPLGPHNVELYALTSGNNGFFYTRPDDKSPGRIKVGIQTRHWDECVSVLLHETLEMAMAHMSVRYEHSGLPNDHASYVFILNHSPQFVDLCERVAMFLSVAFPELEKVYKKHGKTKSKE